MGHDEVPDHRLKGFGVGGHVLDGDSGNHDAGICDLGSVTAVAADDADDSRADAPGKLQALDDIGADVVFDAAPANGEDEQGVVGAQTAAEEPVRVAGDPAVVVDAGGQLGNIVGGRVALDAGD